MHRRDSVRRAWPRLAAPGHVARRAWERRCRDWSARRRRWRTTTAVGDRDADRSGLGADDGWM